MRFKYSQDLFKQISLLEGEIEVTGIVLRKDGYWFVEFSYNTTVHQITGIDNRIVKFQIGERWAGDRMFCTHDYQSPYGDALHSVYSGSVKKNPLPNVPLGQVCHFYSYLVGI